jgi:hypothetical protein
VTWEDRLSVLAVACFLFELPGLLGWATYSIAGGVLLATTQSPRIFQFCVSQQVVAPVPAREVNTVASWLRLSVAILPRIRVPVRITFAEHAGLVAPRR